MEFVVILAAVAVAVLQIITISVVVSTKKKIEELSNQKSNSSHNDRERRDRDFRSQQNTRRPVMDSRSKAQTQPATTPSASVDQVEKSLRDINLKLKNAERDQENARKKMQTNFSKDSNGNNPRRRDNRDHHSRGGRDNSRNNHRGNNHWQERNRQDNTGSQEIASDLENVNVDATIPFEAQPTVQQPESAVVSQSTPAGLEPSDFGSSDILQHGRKASVKRRLLKEEDSIIENNSSENAVPAEQPFSTENEPGNSSSEPNETEIKFGRR
jgi:hypothetical protein